MSERKFIKAADAREIPEGKRKAFLVGNEPAVLFHIGDKFFAVRNRCPHQLFEKLHEGDLDGVVLTCPMHGWKFDVRSGTSVNFGGSLKTWRTQIHGDNVMVECGGEC